MAKITITWKKSTIGSVQSHRATIASLGSGVSTRASCTKIPRRFWAW